MDPLFHEKIHHETISHITNYLSSHKHNYESSLLVETDKGNMAVWYEEAAPLSIFHMQAEECFKLGSTGRFTFTLANTNDVSYKYEDNTTKGVRMSDIYVMWKVYMACRDHIDDTKGKDSDDYDYEWNRDKYCN